MKTLLFLGSLWAVMYIAARIIDRLAWDYAPPEYKWKNRPRNPRVKVKVKELNRNEP